MDVVRHDDVAAHEPLPNRVPGGNEAHDCVRMRQNGLAAVRVHGDEKEDGMVADAFENGIVGRTGPDGELRP